MKSDDSAGFFAEDAVVGTHTVSDRYEARPQREIVDFAGDWDPRFFHVDAVAAKDGAFGGIIASGIHTLAIYQRLEVASRAEPWHVIAGVGIENLRFHRPVRPGDTLAASSTLTSCELEPDSRRGLLTFSSELVNQDAKAVMTMAISAYLHMRPVGPQN